MIDDIGDHCLFLITLTGWTKCPDKMMILVITAYSRSLWMGGQPMILVITAYSWSLKLGGQTMILVITALFLITSNGCTNLMILVITECLRLFHTGSWSLWWYSWSLLISEHSTWFHKNNKKTMVKLVPHPGHWDCISLMFVQPFTHVSPGRQSLSCCSLHFILICLMS